MCWHVCCVLSACAIQCDAYDAPRVPLTERCRVLVEVLRYRAVLLRRWDTSSATTSEGGAQRGVVRAG